MTDHATISPLSDAELDAVTGGQTVIVSGANGGAGGEGGGAASGIFIGNVGGNVGNRNRIGNANTADSLATGGAGGDGGTGGAIDLTVTFTPVV
jgi:hypothetical protein